MARISEGPSPDARIHGGPRRSGWRERAFVLGGLALAAPVTAVSLVLGAGGEAVGLVWLVAVAWTALASLAAALRSGFLHGDWSAFRSGCGPRHECHRHECPPDTRAESFDWNTRTGAFAHLRIRDDRERLLDDRPGGHDPGF